MMASEKNMATSTEDDIQFIESARLDRRTAEPVPAMLVTCCRILQQVAETKPPDVFILLYDGGFPTWHIPTA